MKILLVDDQEKIRHVIRHIISRFFSSQVIFLEAANGAEAVQIYRDHHPDWILMDIMMTPINGLTATEMILKINPAAKIMIITAYDDPVYREEAKRMKVAAYVLKEDLNEIPVILKTVL